MNQAFSEIAWLRVGIYAISWNISRFIRGMVDESRGGSAEAVEMAEAR